MIRRTRWARLIRKSWSETLTGGWAADASSLIRFYTFSAVADVIDLARQQREGGVPDRPRTGVGPDHRIEGDDLAASDVADLTETRLQGAGELLGVAWKTRIQGRPGRSRAVFSSAESRPTGCG